MLINIIRLFTNYRRKSIEDALLERHFNHSSLDIYSKNNYQIVRRNIIHCKNNERDLDIFN